MIHRDIEMKIVRGKQDTKAHIMHESIRYNTLTKETKKIFQNIVLNITLCGEEVWPVKQLYEIK